MLNQVPCMNLLRSPVVRTPEHTTTQYKIQTEHSFSVRMVLIFDDIFWYAML